MTGETLLRVLDESVRRHGEDKPLTIGHLRNIVRLALRAEANREERSQGCNGRARRGQEVGQQLTTFRADR